MKSARKTIAWLVLLLLAGGAGGSYYFYKIWEQGDELLRQRLITRLHEVAPEWDLSLGTTRFDHQGRVRIADFQLNLAGSKPPTQGMSRSVSRLLEVPEAIITLDKARMTEDRPSIRHVRMIRPTLYAVRHADGRWGWENLPPAKFGNSMFEWEIEEGTIHVRLEETVDSPAGATVFKNVRLQFVPSSQEEFEIRGSGGFDFATSMTLSAHWSMEKKTWLTDGRLEGLKFGPALVEFLAACSPEFRKKGELLESRLADHTPPTHLGAQSSRGTTQQSDVVQPPGLQAAWGLNAVLDLDFHAKRWQPTADPEFSLKMQLNEGEFVNPAFPFPLAELRGLIHYDNRKLEISKLTARSDAIRFGLNGMVLNPESPGLVKLTLTATDLPFGTRLRNSLPVGLQPMYDSMQPTGWLNAITQLDFDSRNGWQRKTDLTLKNCTARPAKFPYLIEQISGAVKQRGQTVRIIMDGQAGRRPVHLEGTVVNPGPEAEATCDVWVDQLPVDDRFREACEPGILKALDSLRFQGEMNAHLTLIRPPGLGQRIIPNLTAEVHRATIKPKSFPYALREVSGIVQSEGESSWKFLKLKGQHDGAEIDGEGSYSIDAEGTPHLNLMVKGYNLPIDQNLYQALPDSCQTIYRELAPTGMTAKAFATRFLWSPGHEPEVKLATTLSQGSFSVKSFPFELDEVQANLYLERGRLVIKSLSGKHDETYVQFTGSGDFAPGEEWRIRLENLLVEDLNPDRRFRKMLPARLREVFETLDPRGKLTVKGMVEFRGTCEPSDPVTAAWDLDTTYSGATLTAGIDLENMHGQVSMHGTWDGESVAAKGNIDLDSVSIKGYQFTELQGPIRIRGNELILGSEAAIKGLAKSVRADSDAAREQITAKFIGGKMVFDGLAILGKQTTYYVHLNLREAQLAQYAQLYVPGRNQLRGLINGWINLSGQGASPQRISGHGQLKISPAALYELPIIVQIFNVLRLASPNKTAFNHAFVDFDVGGGQYHIRQADLVGDTIQLRGRGSIGFSGMTSLDFYSMMPKHQMPIPIVREFLGEATKGWVGVNVRGPMSNPTAKVRAVPQIDDTMRMFLGMGLPGNGGLRHNNSGVAGGGQDTPRSAPQQFTPPARNVPGTFDARNDNNVTPR